MTQTPAGWYPAPENDGRRRYWDGTAWTEHYDTPAAPPSQPGPHGNQPGPLTDKRRRTNRRILSIVGGVVGLIVLASCIGAVAGSGSDDDDTANDTKPKPSATASKAPTAAPSSTTPSSTAPTTAPAPAAPEKPTDVAAAAIRDLDRDVDLSSIALNRDQPNSMTVRYKVKDNLSKGLIRTGIGEDVFAVAQGALDSGVPFRTLWVQGTFPTTDKFGKEDPDSQILQVRFSRKTLEQINFDSITATTYDNMDDLAIGGSFFLLPDLRE